LNKIPWIQPATGPAYWFDKIVNKLAKRTIWFNEWSQSRGRFENFVSSKSANRNDRHCPQETFSGASHHSLAHWGWGKMKPLKIIRLAYPQYTVLNAKISIQSDYEHSFSCWTRISTDSASLYSYLLGRAFYSFYPWPSYCLISSPRPIVPCVVHIHEALYSYSMANTITVHIAFWTLNSWRESRQKREHVQEACVGARSSFWLFLHLLPG